MCGMENFILEQTTCSIVYSFMMTKLFLFLILLIPAHHAFSRDLVKGEVMEFKIPSTQRLAYIYIPRNAPEDLSSLSIILSIHGTDGTGLLEMGPNPSFDGQSQSWPYIVEHWSQRKQLIVIAPTIDYSGNGRSGLCYLINDEHHVLETMEFFKSEYGLKGPLYLTGFSSGATFALLILFRDLISRYGVVALSMRHSSLNDIPSMNFIANEGRNRYTRTHCESPLSTPVDSYNWRANDSLRHVPIHINNGSQEVYTATTQLNIAAYRTLINPFFNISQTVFPFNGSCGSSPHACHYEDRELSVDYFFRRQAFESILNN